MRPAAQSHAATYDGLLARAMLDHALPRAEARILLGAASGRSAEWLIAHGDDEPAADVAARFAGLAGRRGRGEPVAYLTGKREFHGRPFRVGPAVLIPRPETECLVALALEALTGVDAPRVLDLGTGSGHAAFVLASLGHEVTGLDSSAGMLEIARAHAAEQETKGAAPTFVLGDACDPEVEETDLDAVTSRYLMWTLREPVEALRRWRRLLRPGGVLAVVDSTWFDAGIEGSPPEFIDSYGEVMDDLPLATAGSIEATAEAVRAAGYSDVTITPLTEVLEVDERLGVAPGHRPRLQYLVRGVA